MWVDPDQSQSNSPAPSMSTFMSTSTSLSNLSEISSSRGSNKEDDNSKKYVGRHRVYCDDRGLQIILLTCRMWSSELWLGFSRWQM